jgi:hypothetical protein
VKNAIDTLKPAMTDPEGAWESYGNNTEKTWESYGNSWDAWGNSVDALFK